MQRGRHVNDTSTEMGKDATSTIHQCHMGKDVIVARRDVADQVDPPYSNMAAQKCDVLAAKV